jgi:DNA-binding NarL/FixJ family response regulator
VLKDVHGDDLCPPSGAWPRATRCSTRRSRRRCSSGSGTERTQDRALATLSEQERRVLELIGQGLTNRQIAEQMFLSEKTVKNYVSSVFVKLGLQRRTQLPSTPRA